MMKTKKQLRARIRKLQNIIDEMDRTVRRKVAEYDFSQAEQQKDDPDVGAFNERAAAPQKEEPEVLNKRSEILRAAEELINRDRAQTYGPPEVTFGRIADIFNAMGYRHHVPVGDIPLGYTRANKLDAVDAALILIGMKLSHTIGDRQHMDNWIELAGYSGLGAEFALWEAPDE